LPTCTTLDIDAVQLTLTGSLIEEYADVFVGLGEMPGQYCIELDESVVSVIHASTIKI